MAVNGLTPRQKEIIDRFKNIYKREFKKLLKIIAKKGIDWQSIDFSSADSEHGINELKQWISEQYAINLQEEDIQSEKEAIIRHRKQQLRLQEQHLKETRKEIKSIETKSIKDMKLLIDQLITAIKKDTQGIYSVLIKGQAGFAKQALHYKQP